MTQHLWWIYISIRLGCQDEWLWLAVNLFICVRRHWVAAQASSNTSFWMDRRWCTSILKSSSPVMPRSRWPKKTNIVLRFMSAIFRKLDSVSNTLWYWEGSSNCLMRTWDVTEKLVLTNGHSWIGMRKTEKFANQGRHRESSQQRTNRVQRPGRSMLILFFGSIPMWHEPTEAAALIWILIWRGRRNPTPGICRSDDQTFRGTRGELKSLRSWRHGRRISGPDSTPIPSARF